jgi:hypothetical protein
VYVEFQRRSGYDYLRRRVAREHFQCWAEDSLEHGGAIALGAWEGGNLVAASLSRAVESTWLYSTFFATTQALHHNVASLMLHHVRKVAAEHPGIERVFVGMRKAGLASESKDDFYLHRGAEVVVRPAVLWLNPLARAILMHHRPDLLDGLYGRPTACSGQHFEAGTGESETARTKDER